jgi:ABC-type uncharacterized transport system substrate-binding protein
MTSNFMQRRSFLTLLGGAAAAWPLGARAQQQAMPVIGYLNTRSVEGDALYTAAFRQGLKEIGFVEGQNVVILYRFANGQNDRIPAFATDLVRRQVNVIAAMTGSAATVMALTTTIPIVFSTSNDPVATGVVASLNRPGGNVTGVTTLGDEVGQKRLELLRELLPSASAFAFLVNPAGGNAEHLSEQMHVAARALKVGLHIVRASSISDFDSVFAGLAGLSVGGLVIKPDPFFNEHTEQLAMLAQRFALPTIYQFREFAAAGGLMS